MPCGCNEVAFELVEPFGDPGQNGRDGIRGVAVRVFKVRKTGNVRVWLTIWIGAEFSRVPYVGCTVGKHLGSVAQQTR